MNTAEELLKKIADKLVEAGYVKKVFSNAAECTWQQTFYKPECSKSFYYGTYLNPFSCLDYNEEPQKVYLWTDELGYEEPYVFLQTVYKHNGAEEDVSVDLFVQHKHFTAPKASALSDYDKANKIFMRELAKSPKPITRRIHVDGFSNNVFKVRIRKNASDKNISNILKKVDAAFSSFIPNPHNDELDRADFPADSHEANFKWTEDWKARHAR